MTTPAIGKEEFIGVVGYPCDREDGEHMFEHFLSASWNLAMADRSMLEYSIDTFGGKPAIDFTVLFSLSLNRSIRRCSTTASVGRMCRCTKTTPVPASFEYVYRRP